jgi:hypothetical protein
VVDLAAMRLPNVMVGPLYQMLLAALGAATILTGDWLRLLVAIGCAVATVGGVEVKVPARAVHGDRRRGWRSDWAGVPGDRMKTMDARNIASGIRMVETADTTLLLQGLSDLLHSREAIDGEDFETLGDVLMNLREVTTLLSLVLDPLAEMPPMNLAWLGLDVTGKMLGDPVAKLIQALSRSRARAAGRLRARQSGGHTPDHLDEMLGDLHDEDCPPNQVALAPQPRRRYRHAERSVK